MYIEYDFIYMTFDFLFMKYTYLFLSTNVVCIYMWFKDMSKGLRVVIYVSIAYFLIISLLFIPTIIKAILIEDSSIATPIELVILYIRSLNPITLFWLLYTVIYFLRKRNKKK